MTMSAIRAWFSKLFPPPYAVQYECGGCMGFFMSVTKPERLRTAYKTYALCPKCVQRLEKDGTVQQC